MNTYNYNRELVNGTWNINNQALQDPDGFTISLAKIIQGQFPSKGKICLIADGDNCNILIETALDSAEKAQLDQIVADYKNGIVP
jgi:hypothetical protein